MTGRRDEAQVEMVSRMSLMITKQVQFNGGSRGRKRIEEAGLRPHVPVGRVPRVSRLMALAIRPIAAMFDWRKQRRMWAALRGAIRR